MCGEGRIPQGLFVYSHQITYESWLAQGGISTYPACINKVARTFYYGGGFCVHAFTVCNNLPLFTHIVFYHGISFSMGCYITLTLYAAYVGCAACVRRIYRVYTHVCWRPSTRVYRTKRSKCMFSRNTTFYHRGYIYLYSLLISPFIPKISKTKESKISPTDEFSHVDKIYTGIIFRIFTPPSLSHAKYLE